MAYFKIGNTDLSMYVNQLNISKSVNYSAQTNAAGNTVVDYINSKRIISVGFIPMDAAAMLKIQNAVNSFSVSLSFLNPATNALEKNVLCIAPNIDSEYYTIQANKTLFNEFSIDFTEL